MGLGPDIDSRTEERMVYICENNEECEDRRIATGAVYCKAEGCGRTKAFHYECWRDHNKWAHGRNAECGPLPDPGPFVAILL